jgi:hypothetical protein
MTSALRSRLMAVALATVVFFALLGSPPTVVLVTVAFALGVLATLVIIVIGAHRRLARTASRTTHPTHH